MSHEERSDLLPLSGAPEGWEVRGMFSTTTARGDDLALHWVEFWVKPPGGTTQRMLANFTTVEEAKR